MGRSGGLALLWRKGLDVVLQSMSVHHIDVEVRGGLGDMLWRMTGFYGWPEVQNRHLSWSLLRELASHSTLPWMCIGDFNEILYESKKSGVNDRAEWQMSNFRDAINFCGFSCIPFLGYEFTYDNGRGEGENYQSRLDRALATVGWNDFFPNAHVVHLDREWSDHSPIKLLLHNRENGRLGDKPFRFEQFWKSADGCERVVEAAWGGSVDLEAKMNICARELKQWSDTKFGDVFRELRKKRKNLKKLNRGGLSATQLEQRRRLLWDIEGLIAHEETYWRQRSRVLWLSEGDKNTKFFHQRTSSRKRRNTIKKLNLDDGGVVTGDDDIGEAAVTYFRDLFSSSNPTLIDQALHGFQTRVTDDMNNTLRANYTGEEVKQALSQMHPIKAPGPDGMCPLFFQSYWHIVGPSVTSLVLNILRGAPIPSYLNKTYIALIPKNNNADRMVDFRPISLCNVVYKLVSKVLANKLKVFLDKIIAVNQSAFTPGRLITDNILVAFELFHYMKNLPNKGGCMAMKLDMSKAYDRIEWDFLDAVLERFGFDDGWRRCVMGCVRSVSFSVLINGRPSDEFVLNRGIRQGDPISPYLFILCAEVFSHFLRSAEERASLGDVEVIKAVLETYEFSSGQKINFDKTTVSFSKGVPEGRREEVENMLGVRMVDIHDRYLGLPTVVGRSKKVITKGVKEKLWKKLQGWKGMVLSKAGWEVMIKEVAQSLPTYAMSVFKLPSSFCDELRSLVAQFWWGKKQGERKIHWLSWKKLCRPKKEGGMGLRDPKLFNWALLGKQAWRLVLKPGTLIEQVLKGRYYPNSTFMEANLGVNSSYTWRGIAEARWVVRRGMRWRIEDGESVRVWADLWLPGTQTHRVLSPRGNFDSELKVSELIVSNTGCWKVDAVSQTFLPFEVERVLSIPISKRLPCDVLCWDLEKKGSYSVKSAYRALFDDEWKRDEAAPTTECTGAKAIWDASELSFVAEMRMHTVLDWWESCFLELSESEVAGIITLCWAIWGARNSIMVEGVHKLPGEVVRYARKIGEELSSAKGSGVVMRRGGAAAAQSVFPSVWAPPMVEVVKVNVDAGFVGELGCGLGAVVRDSRGSVIVAGVSQHKERWDVKMAEVKAVLWGLGVVSEKGVRRVEVESDCLQVVQALKQKETGRGGNRVAHELARYQPWEYGQRIYPEIEENTYVSLEEDLQMGLIKLDDLDFLPIEVFQQKIENKLGKRVMDNNNVGEEIINESINVNNVIQRPRYQGEGSCTRPRYIPGKSTRFSVKVMPNHIPKQEEVTLEPISQTGSTLNLDGVRDRQDVFD
ncbi:uncharacterized protein LOC110683843 [Chenopodium quinoa]|uniref:uncharacterized protein LOC110683843 n=1 Tax=Chenopodium quinoa TaxID=63459 RepID=UPI000B784F25|nr:uncharacterized protein LOC110683843 [Chenopodium quinoa]